jgi:hypothetical protein
MLNNFYRGNAGGANKRPQTVCDAAAETHPRKGSFKTFDGSCPMRARTRWSLAAYASVDTIISAKKATRDRGPQALHRQRGATLTQQGLFLPRKFALRI